MEEQSHAEAEGEGEGSDFGTFMHNWQSHLQTMMEKSYRAPKDASEHFAAFSAAINWGQTWIRCLLAFHVANLLFFVATRNNIDLQTAQFMVICLLVLFAERINTLCSQNYQLFADQDYFDSRGAFMGALFSGPLLLVCFFQLFNFLRLASGALIRAKRLELQHRRKGDAAGAGAVDTTAGAAGAAGAAVRVDGAGATSESPTSRKAGTRTRKAGKAE